MVQAVILDALLFLILILLIPLGFYRGGLREVCSAAGLLLGLHIANEWAARWGRWIADLAGIREDVGQFVVAVATLALVTAFVGYGAGAAFSYRPGPGGRMYGGLIALLIGAVFLGSVMNFVARYLSGGDYPELIRQGYLTRVLSIGLDWVLLVVGLAVILSTLFGMVVRERDSDDQEILPAYQYSTDVPAVSTPQYPVERDLQVDKVEPSEKPGPLEADTTAAITIKEVRHWEDPTPPKTNDLASGWHRTWPASGKGNPFRARSEAQVNRVPEPETRPPDQQSTGSRDARIIREWLGQDQDEQSREARSRPTDLDE